MSGKKKGLSAEQKKEVILEIYHSHVRLAIDRKDSYQMLPLTFIYSQKEPFNLKEIEGLASKRGVVLQTVKENNQSLIDDNLVCQDKIGASNFFWSFPSQALHEQNLKKRNLEEMIAASTQNCINEQNRIEELTVERSSPDRPEKLQKLYQLREELARLDHELEQRRATDPEETQRILAEAEANRRAADRWTENMWNIKKYLTKKKGMSGKEVDKLLGIDGNFDYVTYTTPSSSRKK